ncbi:MAG: phage terminase large subunit [Lentisphaeria bacterium]|nr:phage terminase large subunit [Lentisphaeria bacterium]
MSDEIFSFTPDQLQALKLLASDKKYLLLFGGSRSGKTFVLVYALLVRALRSPGSRHLIARLHGNGARQAIGMDTLPKVVRLAFPGLQYYENRTENFIVLPNNSEIWFGGLDAGERADKILGKEYATIYFNECSEMDYEAVSIALTRLAQNCNLLNRAYFDCNPSGKAHWSYKLFVRKIDPLSNGALPHPEQYDSMILNPAGNMKNLPPDYLSTTLGNLSFQQRKRFLEGVWLEEVEGALWNRMLIDRSRVTALNVKLQRLVVGVDPAVTGNPASDETGIILAGLGEDRHYYILRDVSLHGSVYQWAQRVCDLYREQQADRVIGEVNNGGELIEMALRQIDSEISFRSVRAARGKIARAEPIAALYEQNKVHHVGEFPELEEQMCSYALGRGNQFSPDRMDAMVWAMHELSGGNCASDRWFLA